MRSKYLLLGLVLVLGTAASAWASGTMSVQVKKGKLYSGPSFLSNLKATMSYGAKLKIDGEKGAWRQVRTSKGAQGWMHISALTEKPVSLQAGSGAVSSGASREEMTLAGKGFNKQVEARYRSQHKGLNYRAVDEMEQSYPVSVAQIRTFIENGGLHAPRDVVPPASKGSGRTGGKNEPEGGAE